ncbi:MAG: YihY/virulence factor BrkB family protein [Planctomycetes bacterium]|nr:YihY/virulence factor BrkB family protein [Planctomycetota bacterium]
MKSLRDPCDDQPFQNRWIAAAWQRFARWVTKLEPDREEGVVASLHRGARIAYLSTRDFFLDRCLLQASSLTYVTVLSLVPLLAFAFALAKGLGAYDKLRKDTIEPFLANAWGARGTAPAGIEQIRGTLDGVLDFVETTNFGALGAVGLIVLLYTVVRLLGSVELVFNEIWGVQRSRSLVRKLTDYLAMVVITPIFLFAATAASAGASALAKSQIDTIAEWMKLHFGFGGFVELLFSLTSIAMMWIALTFVYLTLPNTKVRWSSALIGGLLAGAAWHVAQILHVKFQVGIASYNKIYAGFAAMPLFLVWLYFSWAIVLFGAELAWAHQAEPNFRPALRARTGEPAFRELLALRCAVRIARAFLRGEPAPSSQALADDLGLDHGAVDGVLRVLATRELLVARETDGATTFLPSRDPGLISVKAILDALRGDSGREDLPAANDADRVVDRLLGRLDQEFAGSAHNKDLRALVAEIERDARSLQEGAVERPAEAT